MGLSPGDDAGPIFKRVLAEGGGWERPREPFEVLVDCTLRQPSAAGELGTVRSQARPAPPRSHRSPCALRQCVCTYQWVPCAAQGAVVSSHEAVEVALGAGQVGGACYSAGIACPMLSGPAPCSPASPAPTAHAAPMPACLAQVGPHLEAALCSMLKGERAAFLSPADPGPAWRLPCGGSAGQLLEYELHLRRIVQVRPPCLPPPPPLPTHAGQAPRNPLRWRAWNAPPLTHCPALPSAAAQVRDMTGDGSVTKRRVRDGVGEFPMDCPLEDCAVRVHYKRASPPCPQQTLRAPFVALAASACLWATP